jgi:hypothetical protein
VVTLSTNSEFKPSISFNAVYYGAEADGLALLQPFLDLPNTEQNISVVPWNELYKVQDFGADLSTCEKNTDIDFYGMGLKNVDAATYGSFFDELAEFYDQHPTLSPIWVTERYSTALALTVPGNATAYAHRELGAHQYVYFQSYNITVDRLSLTVHQVVYDLGHQPYRCWDRVNLYDEYP